MDTFYNKERKDLFISERRERAILSNNILNLFELSAKKEAAIGRDICEWNTSEILDFYRYYSTSSIQSLIQLNNSLTIYTDWCLVNGFVSNNQNHFREINSDALLKCVDNTKLDRTIYTRKELLKTIKELPNFSDQFLMLGIFEGIPTKDGLITKIKFSDLNGNELMLPNKNIIHISKELTHIINMAAEEDKYQSMGKLQIAYDYIESDCIFKGFYARSHPQQNPAIMMGVRMRNCCAYLGVQKMTIRNIAESGRIYLINQMMLDNSLTPQEVIENRDLRKIIETRYGKIQNYSVYLKRYEKYFGVENL